jgi:hypothetical protein
LREAFALGISGGSSEPESVLKCARDNEFTNKESDLRNRSKSTFLPAIQVLLKSEFYRYHCWRLIRAVAMDHRAQ